MTHHTGALPASAAGTPVELVYHRLAPIYDLVFGVGLQEGRRQALARLAPRAGEEILEVGVGTGLSAVFYPSNARVVGVDLSSSMLARARARLDRLAIDTVTLCRMDAARLAFPDNRFDAVYAPYLVTVVSDPVGVAREMMRVCKPGGRLVWLNHFASSRETEPLPTRVLGRVAERAFDINLKLELDSFLRETGLTPLAIDAVNFRMSSVVLCRKPAHS